MRVAAGVGIERLRVQMISKGEHHVKRPETLIPFLRWGMVGGGEPVRSATATAVRRCVTMFIPCWPARLTSMPSAGARSVSNWASRRSAATPTTRPCFAKRRSALTGSRSSRSPPRTIPISPSPKRRWSGTPRYLRKALCFTAEEARELVDLSKNRTKSSASPTAMPAIR